MMGTQQNQAALVPVEQDSITFYGHELVAVRLDDGRIAAVLRWLCESLRLDSQGQIQRIQRKTALADGLVLVRVDTVGGPQVMHALALDVLPGYLFTIDESRVNPLARTDVVLFQRECVKALADHFARKHTTSTALTPTMPEASAAAAISEQITDLIGVVNLLREHLAALLPLPSQVADLSAQASETRALVETLAARQETAETQLAAVDTRTQRLTPAHTRAVQEQVDHMVRETKRVPTQLTYATIYGRLKHRFRVGSYKEVADDRFDELMNYLREELRRATSGQVPEQSSLL